MDSKRRALLKFGALATGAMALQPLSGQWLADAEAVKKGRPFGIQLWTLREDMPKDPKGVLKQLADAGYKQIESFEGSKGMYWGMTNKEFAAYLASLGMSIKSCHCDIEKDFERKAAEAAEIGIDYLICPWKGPQKSIDDFKRFAEQFNAKGEVCKKAGIRFAYHNHDYSFVSLDGQLPQDVMMQGTDPALVYFQMDMYWVVTAGADPVEWLKKYPNRFKLCHIKDRTKGAEGKDASCTLGTGSIDYKSILKKARKYGMQYFVVEQEKYEGTTPIQSAVANAAYLRGVKW